MLPFIESNISKNIVERYFANSIEDIELVWHRDLETRIIKSIEDTDWRIQLDNELPKSINKDVTIDAGRWHRLIKGTGDLVLKIVKI